MDTAKTDPTFSEIENARRRWLSAGRPVSRRAIDIHTVNPDNPFDEPCWRVDGIEQLISTNDFIAQAPLAPTQAPAAGLRPPVTQTPTTSNSKPNSRQTTPDRGLAALVNATTATPAASTPAFPHEEKLPPKLLRRDGGTQPRAALDEDTINDYVEAMRAGARFPPVIAYHDGQNHWLVDGFHRVNAAMRIDLTYINAIIHAGTQREAILYSVGANATHGLRRTNADKRRSVERLLLDEEWRQWSDAEIARRTAVDAKTVASVRAHLTATLEFPESTERITSDGRRMDVTNIGARPAAPAAPAPLLPVSPSPLLPVSPSTASTPPRAPSIPAEHLQTLVETWAADAHPAPPARLAALFSIVVSKANSPHWPRLLNNIAGAGHPIVDADDLLLAVSKIHSRTQTAIHIASQTAIRTQNNTVLTARQDRAAHITSAIIEPAAHALANALLSSDPGAWALVYRQVCHESAPADLSTADLVAGLAAHWLRAGLDINTRDRNEPNVVREEITRTLMRHSIPPPWITTSEERAFALTEQSS